MRTPRRLIPGTLLALALAALAVGAVSSCNCSPCPEGESPCGSKCIDLSITDSDCGACGNVCGKAQHCAGGACVDGCAAGKTLCGDTCVNLQFSLGHCGACDSPCGATQYCANAMCHSRSGSCPYLFLFEDGAYRYHTDLSGSPLAAGLDFFKPEFYGTNVYELGTWGPDQGVYKLRLRELIYEASYFDHAQLVLADVPEGYEVYNEWASTPQLLRLPSLRYVSVKGLRAPLTAVSDTGVDVRDQVSRVDGVPMPVTRGGLSRVVVDFGPVEHPERARLAITTWGVYEDLRDAQKPPYSGGTTIETPDGAGGWKERVVAGKSASDARTWILDLAGVLEKGQGRMRITLAHQPSTLDVLDAVRLDDSEPVPVTLTPVQPRVAELSFEGAAQVTAATLDRRIQAKDLKRPVDPDALLTGDYTKFGDVRPLLAKADDRFVLMSQGDALYLEFEAPPQAPKTTRRAFLQADVFYTLKFHPFGQLTDTLEPLPFHGMKTYPYPAEEWPYRGDEDYARYRAEWNTRKIP